MTTHREFFSTHLAVRSARDRLARVAGRRLLRRSGLWVLLGAAAIGAARPIFLPLDDAAPLWSGIAWALGITLVLSIAGLVTLWLVGRTEGPSPLSAARAVDGALGLREVVASGWAFEDRSDAGREPLVDMARARAASAAEGFDPQSAFSLPSLRPGWRQVSIVGLALAMTALFGAYHPALAAILVSPPDEAEQRAAAALDRLADEMDRRHARSGEADRDRRTDALDDVDGGEESASRRDTRRRVAARAREAARAARRGDRQGALRHLDDLGREGQGASREAAALREALRRIASALASRHARPASRESAERSASEAPTKNGSASGAERGAIAKRRAVGDEAAAGREQKLASELLSELARRLAGPSKEGRAGSAERRETLEALAKAVAGAERAASGAETASERQMAQKLAEALTNAGRSLSGRRRSEASRQLESAVRRAQKMESARARALRHAEAIARMLKAAGALGRSIQMTMAGREGGRRAKSGMPGRSKSGAGRGAPGRGAGSAKTPGSGSPSSTDLARALALRLAALGMSSSDPSGNPGSGREGSANNFRTPGSPLSAKSGMRARAVMREGDRAVTAIQGLGRSAEPDRELRDLYPSYSALAEEALADEVVPAAQREVVRRYFESIRPGGAETSAAPGAPGE